MAEQKGSCLCGAVTFTAKPEGKAGVCHCGMCRKWSGGMYLSVKCSDVEFVKTAALGSYKGSAWGERLFCTHCGSSVLWKTQDGVHQHVSIQSFKDPSQFELGVQVFIDKKPDNYALENKTATMTEAEVFAMFAPEGEQGQ